MSTFTSTICQRDGWSDAWISSDGIDNLLSEYCFITELHRGLRERSVICNQESYAPASSYQGARGVIENCLDNHDGTITFLTLDDDENLDTPIDWSTKFPAWPVDEYPASFNLVLFPADSPDASELGEVSHGLVFGVEGYGQYGSTRGYITVVDDGRLLLNCDAYSRYVGFRYQVVRGGAPNSITSGFGFPQRYPPRPNDPEYDYGEISANVEGTGTAGSDTTHIEDSTKDADAGWAGQSFVGLYVEVEVSTDVWERKTIIDQQHSPDVSHVLLTVDGAYSSSPAGKTYRILMSSETYLVDNRLPSNDENEGFQLPKTRYWPNLLIQDIGTSSQSYREIRTKVKDQWVRIPITDVDLEHPENPKLIFDEQDEAPTGGYWIGDIDTWWRPEFRLKMQRCVGRRPSAEILLSRIPTSDYIFWSPRADTSPPLGGSQAPWYLNDLYPWNLNSGGTHWRPLSTWTSIYTDKFGQTHGPDDDLIDNGLPDYTGSSGGGRVSFDHAGDPVIINSFDVGYAIDTDDVYGIEIRLLNPYFYGWSIRGLQYWVNDIFGGAAWIEPKDYSEANEIEPWTISEWEQYYNEVNTRITSVAGIVDDEESGAAVISLEMPIATPEQGAWDALECTWTLKDGDKTKKSGTGTVTSTTLSGSIDFVDHVDDTDVGLTLIISFGRSRRYPRRFKYMYPKTVWIPDVAGDPSHDILPGDELFDENPGRYETINPSTNYAVYNKYGVLEETGPEFIDGESAVYVGNNFFDENYPDNWHGVSYAGLPNVESQSDFPRWEGSALTGVVELADTYTGGGWISDSTQDWELGSTQLNTWTGTADSSSNASHITVTSRAGDASWDQVDRFGGGVIIEVSNDAGVTWEPRPCSTYNSATQTLTPIAAFSFTASSKMYRFNEPGFSAVGVLANIHRGSSLKITSAIGETSTLDITHSDRHRIFYAGDADFDVDDTCRYEIIKYRPGITLQYNFDDDEWLLPEDAVQDDRGQDWHLGNAGPLENAPTHVHDYGFFRCGDISSNGDVWYELMHSIDALRWTKGGADVHSRADLSIPEINYWSGGALADGLHDPSPDPFATGLSTAASNVGSAYDAGNEYPAADYTHVEIDNYMPRAGSSAFINWTDDGSGGHNYIIEGHMSRSYAYAYTTPETTQLQCIVDFYNLATAQGTWDDNGDDVLEDLYDKWDTSGPSNTTPRISSKLGSDPSIHPNFVSGIATPTDDGDYSYGRGYIVMEIVTIRKWDVEGGLSYVTV